MDADVHHDFLTRYIQWAAGQAFPFDPKPRTKPFITDATEKLLNQRREARHAATHLRRLAHSMDQTRAAAVHEAADESLRRWRALGKDTRKAVADDKNNYIAQQERLAEAEGPLASADRLREVLQIVRPPNKKKGPVQPLKPFAASPHEAARDGQEFFAQRELGNTMQESISFGIVNQTYDEGRCDLPQPSCQVVTSRRKLEGSFGRAPKHRGAGEDTLAGEIYAADAGCMGSTGSFSGRSQDSVWSGARAVWLVCACFVSLQCFLVRLVRTSRLLRTPENNNYINFTFSQYSLSLSFAKSKINFSEFGYISICSSSTPFCSL